MNRWLTVLLFALLAAPAFGYAPERKPFSPVPRLHSTGWLKIGHFTISFNDLAVPVPGLPLQITRTYDSRAAAAGIQGDFGIGWTMDIRNVRLQKNRSLSRNWDETTTGSPWDLSLAYHLDPVKARLVTITFPDGRVEKFRLDPAPLDQALIPIDTPQWRFTPLGNTRGALVPAGYDEPDGNFLYFAGAIPGTGDLFDLNTFFDWLGSSATEEELYRAPTLFRYATPEGYRYLIDEIAGLQSVTDPNGNTLLISTNGLTWTNSLSTAGGEGQGEVASLTIAFQRDPQGRITNIVDAAGHAMSYGYGTNGNLVSFVDRVGQTDGFAYTNAAFPHHLTGIVDAPGVMPVRNECDANGRLVGNVDAFGNAIGYGHDLADNREYVTNRLGYVTISEYDEHGNVTRVIDPLQGVTLSSYDDNGNLLATVDPLNRTNRYTYDALDNRLTATDPLGNTTRFTYGAQRRVTSVTDPRASTITNVFDDHGNLLLSKDANNSSTFFSYNTQGLPVSIADAAGNMVSNAYNNLGRLTSMATRDAYAVVLSSGSYSYDANGNPTSQSLFRSAAGGGYEWLTTQIDYDALNRPVRIINPDGTTNQTIYNSIGKPAVIVDQLGRQTFHEYDNLGQLVRTTYPDTTCTATTFDAEGRVLTTTEKRGFVTTNAYDALGRLVSTHFPDGTSTTNYYNVAGQLVAATDARTNTTFYGYDAAGRNVAVTNALGEVTIYGYDANGNRTSMRDALGRLTTYAYNYRNLLTNTTFADGTSQTVNFDAFGRRISQSDQAGKVTQYGYDALGHLVALTNALGHVTRYEYNEVGHQIAQVDANLHRTTYQYDLMGRRITRTLPGLQSETYAYDNAGNMTGRTDFNGRVTTYVYDAMNRLLQKQPDPRLTQASVTFTYSASGQRTSMSDASGVSTYSYDNRDRLTFKATPQGTLGYAYDANGNLLSIQSSNTNGTSVAYEWDALNRLSAVNDAHLGRSAYTYDAAGNLRGYAYPNAVNTIHEFDALNRLTNSASSHVLTPIAGYRYTLGLAGNRLSVQELNGRSATYAYDDTYRLLTETVAGAPAAGMVSYLYDPVGNRVSRTSTLPGVTTSAYGFDSNDRLSSDQHDANGNTTFGQQAEGIFASDQYDFEDRLISRNNGAIQIVYDGDGNRVAKVLTTATNVLATFYLVDELNPSGYAQVVEELTVDGAQFPSPVVTRTYTWGHMLVSQDQFDGVAWQPSFYGYDGSGNVRYLTSLNGQMTDSYDYDANGVLIGISGNTPNSYLYRGQQYDSDLGLYYLRARYHNPNTGRFWNQDTFEGTNEDPQSLHKYTYAHNNPVNLSDPSGNSPLTEQLIVTGLAPTVRTMVQRMFVGALFGGTISGLDAYISGEPTEAVWKTVGVGSGMGAGFAALPCAFWTSSFGKALSLFFTVQGGEGTIQAYEDEQYALAVFRGFTTILPLTSSQLAKALGFCFIGDTQISTEHGLVPIKDIEVGDRVWSWNEKTGETELREVTAIFSREVAELVVINVGDGSFETTPDHPFKTINGWKRAADVAAGGELTNAEGCSIRVESVRLKRGSFRVYNLEVEATHTYYVGRTRAIVHNGCGPSICVRRVLPRLSQGFIRAFDGPPRLRTFKAGETIYRAPWPKEKASQPGIWFGTRETTTQGGTQSMYQIEQHGNPNRSFRTYEFNRDVTVYYGKVKDGTGYQVLFPEDINPGDVLSFLGEGPLQ
jgi:RHS repeat-associated protein